MSSVCVCRLGPTTGFHAVNKTGRVYLHKAKRNSNQTFSKGKTWNLEDLRAVRLEEVSLLREQAAVM